MNKNYAENEYTALFLIMNVLYIQIPLISHQKSRLKRLSVSHAAQLKFSFSEKATKFGFITDLI